MGRLVLIEEDENLRFGLVKTTVYKGNIVPYIVKLDKKDRDTISIKIDEDINLKDIEQIEVYRILEEGLKERPELYYEIYRLVKENKLEDKFLPIKSNIYTEEGHEDDYYYQMNIFSMEKGISFILYEERKEEDIKRIYTDFNIYIGDSKFYVEDKELKIKGKVKRQFRSQDLKVLKQRIKLIENRDIGIKALEYIERPF